MFKVQLINLHMKPLFSIFLFLLFVNLAYSQLSVRNDAYVFVTDEVLYVENDINLTEANSTIYLRDEAQLVQGNETPSNTGIGRLSAYQNGTTHNWAYNFWASPVGNVDVSNSANRPFRANDQFFDVTGLTTSIPTAFTSSYDGTSSPLNIADYWLYSYNPGLVYAEWDYIGQAGNLDSGYGFSMKGTNGSGNNQLYDFRGKPNTGLIETAVSTAQFTLVGNPYPSALDALDYIHDAINSTLITGTLSFWEQDLSVSSHNLLAYKGGYATYTIDATGTVETFLPATFDSYNIDGSLNIVGAITTSLKTAHRYIPIAQGFMIEGLVNGNTRTLNAHREYYKQSGASSEFFRTGESNTLTGVINELTYDENGYQILPSDYKRFRLNVDFNDTYTRQLLHNFHQTATPGFDYGLESNNSEPLTSDSYFILGDMPYVAQANNYNEDLKIPLVIKLQNAMPVRVRIHDIQNFGETQPIYIHDIPEDIYYNLRAQNFNINLEAGNYTSRFEITFKDNNDVLDVSEFETNDFTVFQNNNLAQLVINNPNALDIKSLTLFDVAGKRVMNKVDLSSGTRYEFPTKNLSDGVYVVNIVLKNNDIMNKKIIVSNK